MALLIRLARHDRAPRAALTAAILALAGCALLGGKSQEARDFAFSHRVHVADQGLECGGCHPGAETADEPGIVPLPACQLCHADQDAQKPPERQVAALFSGKQFVATKRLELGEGYVFPHGRHASAGIECAACHGAMDANEDVALLPRITMDACVACHQSRGMQTGCATCHPAIRQDAKPSTHSGTWTLRHGAVARSGSDRTADRCEACHTPTGCASCHETTMPRSHTNEWRRGGHGLTAGLDRSGCATCHKPDTCTSCHAETPPRSHTAGWGAPSDRHCMTCHFPLQSQGCVVCHKGTPSHDAAPPKPPGHNPAANCRLCHTPASDHQVPHVDNGDNCNICHH
jgi:hypothetical protein